MPSSAPSCAPSCRLERPHRRGRRAVGRLDEDRVAGPVDPDRVAGHALVAADQEGALVRLGRGVEEVDVIPGDDRHLRLVRAPHDVRDLDVDLGVLGQAVAPRAVVVDLHPEAVAGERRGLLVPRSPVWRSAIQHPTGPSSQLALAVDRAHIASLWTEVSSRRGALRPLSEGGRQLLPSGTIWSAASPALLLPILLGLRAPAAPSCLPRP